MKCSSCGLDLIEGKTTFVRDLGSCLIIIRNVPCFNCKECNEVFYSADVLDKIDRIVQSCKDHAEEISVVDYKKSAA